MTSVRNFFFLLQIFFEPLKHVFGHTTAPGLVLKHCETYEEKSKIHNLGICLGITEWQEDFKKKLVPSTAEVEVLEGCGVAKVIDGKRRGLEEPDETQDIQKVEVLKRRCRAHDY